MVPCKNPKSSQEEETSNAVFLPHMMFSTLEKEYPEKFAEMFNTSDLELFWNAAEKTQDDRLFGHPMKHGNRAWKSQCIPLFLHGDGVQFQTRDTLMVWSWGCFLSLYNSLDSHLLMAVFPKSCTLPITWNPIMKWLVWSFTALAKGIHPVLDPDDKPFSESFVFATLAGQPLTKGGFKGVLWSIQGDHEFFSNVLGLPHWTNLSPCWECDATRNEQPANKCIKTIRPSKQNFVKVTNALAKAEPRSRHAIFTIPGVTTKLVRGDGLHILYTDGVYSHLLGSILHYLCWKDGPGQTQSVQPWKRLDVIFEHIQKLYKEQKTSTRLTNLKLTMFTSPKSPQSDLPCLSCKGSEAKHFAPALLAVCKAILDKGDAVDRHIVEALESICSLSELFDTAAMFLTPHEHAEALEKAETFLDSYDWLSQWALAKERKLFRVRMKFHTFQHLVENSRFLNPRFHWNFKSEDFVGKISILAHSVTSGVSTIRLGIKVCPKYKLLLHLRLTRDNFGLSNLDDEE